MISLDSIADTIISTQALSPHARIIAIDGPAGAGKSTLASRISEKFMRDGRFETRIHTVHMDDIYDGWENALSDSLTKTLINQIVVPVSSGKRFGYRRYDWISRSFGKLHEFPAPELLILEGVGSGQRPVRRYLDQLIWIDIESEIGLQRVLRRDGDYLENEMRVWQMKESEHFRIDNTRDSATIRIDGNYFI